MLIVAFAGTRLRYELDRIPLWQGNDIGVRALWELFAEYVYLPRLRDTVVFLGAVQNGVASLTWNPDTFAYAEGYDEKASRHLGLNGGQNCIAILDSSSLLVKPDGAAKQVAVDQVGRQAADVREAEIGGEGTDDIQPVSQPAVARPRRFHGSVVIDPVRANKEIAEIVDDVVQHLVGNGDVTLRLEIEANIPDGAPDSIVRTVNENARVLKFESFGFEEE